MNIRLAATEDISAVAHIMAQSFLHEELYAFLVPDPVRRGRFLEDFMVFRLRYGMSYGKTFVTDDLQGVVVCMPPEAHMKITDMMRYGAVFPLLRCGPASVKRLIEHNNDMDAVQAKYAPGDYWHIAPICVAPEAQGKGYGTALMKYALENVVPDGVECILDTQKEKNVGYYEKFGFAVRHRSFVPNSQVPNILMVRAAK